MTNDTDITTTVTTMDITNGTDAATTDATTTTTGTDVTDADWKQVGTALTEWTRTVRRLLDMPEEEDEDGIDDEWDHEQALPEFQSVWMETHEALTGLLQQLLRASRGAHDDDDMDRGGVYGTTAEDPSHSLAALLEQCRDDYEVGMQQVEIYLARMSSSSSSLLNQTESSTEHPENDAPTTKWFPAPPTASSLVRHKPQDVHPLTHHYCRHHHPLLLLYPRTLPFVPRLVIWPLPFHHSSTDPNHHHQNHPTTTPDTVIHMIAGNGYDNRYGALRSITASSSTTTITATATTTPTTATTTNEYAPTHYCDHLYRTEIEQLTFSEDQISCCEEASLLPPIHVVHIHDVDHNNNNNALPYTYVDTEAQLQAMIQVMESNQIRTLAIDLEAHSVRTFSGLVCLMQLSFVLLLLDDDDDDDDARDGRRPEAPSTTTSHDVSTTTTTTNNNNIQNYVVDTLALHDVLPLYLSPIMVNPNIVKVFHGADMDIAWLQRDFSIYVVNLFDTYRAAKYINEYRQQQRQPSSSLSRPKFPSLGYAGLVKHYCQNYTINKQYQLSDWRIRPLPHDMIQYAVQDTYYLISIYEYIKYDLYHECGGSSAISNVLDISKHVSLIRYCPPPFDPYGYRSLLSLLRPPSSVSPSNRRRGTNKKKVHHTITVQQEMILKSLWDWRDQVARQEDESTLFVCSNAQLLRIIYSINYTDRRQISESHLLSVFRSTSSPALSSPPPLLIKYVADLCQLVQNTIIGTNAGELSFASTLPTTTLATEGDAEKDDIDDLENDDGDDDELEDEDEDDEEVANSGLIDSTILKNTSTTQDTATSTVGPSRNSGSAFFKPAVRSGNSGGGGSGIPATTATLGPTSRTHHISTATSISDGENIIARSSPVLGTEALYEQAGWLTPSDSVPHRGQVFPKDTDRQRLIATIDKPSIATGSSMTTNSMVTEVNDGTKPRKFLSVHGSNQEFRSDSLSGDGLQLNQTAVDGLGLGRLRGNQKTAPVPVVSIVAASAGNPSSEKPLILASVNDATGSSTWKEAIPAVLGLISSAKANDGIANAHDDDDENDDDDDDIDANENRNDQQSRSANDKGRVSDRMMKVDVEEEFVIPRSIREIYMISNRNRRNKKTGSPTPERGVTPTNEKERLALTEAEALLLSRGDITSQYFTDEATSGKRQKQRSKSSTGRESEETLPQFDSSTDVASKEDDFNFMKSIGWIPNSDGVTVEAFLNQRPTTTSLSSATGTGTVDNELPMKQVAMNPTIEQIGVIHPASQQLWNSGTSTNPFFTGAASQAGGPLQQQRNFGGPNKGGKSSSHNTTTATTNRPVERPDKKDGRSYAYRKR